MDVHNDLFLSASLVGEAMLSMVSTVARNTGKTSFLHRAKVKAYAGRWSAGWGYNPKTLILTLTLTSLKR